MKNIQYRVEVQDDDGTWLLWDHSHRKQTAVEEMGQQRMLQATKNFRLIRRETTVKETVVKGAK